MTDTDGGPAAEAPPKATLFCPECPYAARTDGDWRRVRSVRTTRYRCPECGATVTTRPGAAATALGPYDYWCSAWATWAVGLRFWQGLAGQT